MKTKLTTLLCLLVMCLFVVASLVACPADGVDGKSAYQLWLDQGNTGTVQDFVNSLRGEQGEAGKGIASVERNDAGELVVTYTDGTSENLGKVVFEDPSIKCEHEFAQYVLQAATCTTEGHVLNVCKKDCGYAKMTYTDMDPENHSGLEVEHLDPTCLEDGYDKAICTGCDWADEAVAIPALGHDYTEDSKIVTAPTCEKDGSISITCQRCGDVDVTIATEENGLLATGHSETGKWVVVVDEGANICLDGGMELLICENCYNNGCIGCAGKILDTKVIAATGHVVTADWTVTTAPTLDAAGELAGFCAKCGTNATVELPKLNTTDYKYEVTTPATCTVEGVDTYTITVGEWTGSFTVKTSTVHLYNGHKMPLDKIYAPSEVGRLYGNAPATCLDASGKGSFVCDVCGIDYLVSVKGACKNDILVEEVASTCTTQGHKTYKCSVCEETTTVYLPLKAHVYGAPVVEKKDNKFQLTFKCANCTDTKVVVCDEYTSATTPATCAAPGKIVYTFKYTFNGVETTETYTQILDQLEHNYKGTSIHYNRVYELSELKEIFGDDLADLNTYGNQYYDCATKGYVSFICSDCGVPFLFEMTGDHIWKQTGKTGATCTADGYFSYVCERDEAHTKTEKNPADLAKGHKYELSNEKSNFTKGELVFVCKNGCGEDKTVTASKYEEKIQQPTCKADGKKYIVYSYTFNGQLVENAEFILEVLPKANTHTFGTHAIDITKVYTMTQLRAIFGEDLKGLTVYGNYPTICTDDVPVSFVCDVCATPWLIEVIGDHDYTAWTNVPASCETDGYKYRTCRVCNEREEEKTADATGHSFNYTVTAPTADAAGKVVVTCDNCTAYNKEYTLPALNDAAYTTEIVRVASCEAEGLKKLTYVVKDGETEVYTYTANVTLEITQHIDDEPPVESTWTENGYVYTGFLCKSCGKMIVTSKTPVVTE